MSDPGPAWRAVLDEILLTRSPRARIDAEPASRRDLACGIFALDYPKGVLRRNYKEPQIAAAVAGCGPELEAAARGGWLEEAGRDVAARAVNGILARRAEPLFLAARIAVGEGAGPGAVAMARGIAAAARDAAATVLAVDEAEVAGRFLAGGAEAACCAVGIAEERRAFARGTPAPDDGIIALAAPGPSIREAAGGAAGGARPRATPVYARAILGTLRAYKVKRVVHGLAAVGDDGILGAVAAALPEGFGATLRAGPWAKGPDGRPLSRREIARDGERLGLGTGFVLVAGRHFARAIAARLARLGTPAGPIGTIRAGPAEVRITGP